MKTVILALTLAFTQLVSAQLKLPSFLSDGMVLQQKKTNRIWGWAKPQQLVTVEFNKKSYPTFANGHGEWAVLIEPSNAGNAGSITVTADAEKIELKNILMGEVWICSGQSNMELQMRGLKDIYNNELQTANNDNIRFVVVNKTYANQPQQDVSLEKKWSPITPATIGDCSAVAYWYAKKLYAQLKVPIGLVVTSWGGTPAESWTSFEGLHDFKNYTTTFIEKIKPIDLNGINEQKLMLAEKFKQTVQEKIPFLKDVVNPGFDDSKWDEMYLPKQWEDQGYPTLDGIVVFRVTFNVAAADAGKEAVLNMPAIDDIDSTYINGRYLGTIRQWDAVRKYTIPAGVLKAGINSVVIKVEDDGGGGGLSAVEENFNVKIGNTTIPLSGKAKFNIVAALEDITGGHGSIEHQPATLYNGMIAPLLPLSIRGAIWYQGESNADRAVEYRTLFPAMITDWRNHWAQGEFPFLFVQLSSFGPLKTQPAESDWALLREAQTQTLSLPYTGMAVTTDVGNFADIHPHKKQEVGERLAAEALKIAYAKTSAITNGPVMKSFKVQGNQIIVQFNNAAGGLVVKGSQLKHFAIAGADKKFIWADAVIKGTEIIVSGKGVQKPVAVRYAWADSPIDANLYNKDGFPAGQFRTDNW
jgi:sialate O-acetylesterase